MLSKRNSGRFLDKEFNEKRQKAIWNSETFSEWQQNWLQITFPDGSNKYRERTYLLNTQPADPHTKPEAHAIDIRKRRKAGGEGV